MSPLISKLVGCMNSVALNAIFILKYIFNIDLIECPTFNHIIRNKGFLKNYYFIVIYLTDSSFFVCITFFV